MKAELSEFFRLFGATGRQMAAAPRRWSARQWLALAASMAMTVVVYEEKWPIQAVISMPRGEALGFLASFANACGSGYAVSGLGCLAYAAGRWMRRPELARTAVALAVGGLWCWLLTKGGQWLLAEQRPNEGGAMHVAALGGHGVSGHAAGAALLYSPVLAILARTLGRRGRRAAGAVLLAWAGLVGWSRVWLGMHFLWNVVLGFAIGSLSGTCAARAVAASGSPSGPRR